MDVINASEGNSEQQEALLQDTAVTSCTTESDGYDSTDQLSDDFDKSEEEEQDLKSDLQRTIPECYKSDLSSTSSEVTNQDELQATALCQFMDILNDLDEVLDKSLLACLDEGAKFDSDEDDVVCKRIDEDSDTYTEGLSTSVDDDTQVVLNVTAQVSTVGITRERPQFTRGRSKSLSELSHNVEVANVEEAGPVEELRSSMRRLDPILLPAIPAESSCEPLTLPVILFLEHNINLRPTSAPIHLQVTAANLNSEAGSAPLIVGRRTLLMNRALSLPSPGGSEATLGDWTGRNTAQSIARSASASSTSTESLNGVLSPQQHLPSAPDEIDETEEPPFGTWPHRFSSMLACLSCTVGLFNISRFAVFSVHFGASFIIQFLILSLLIGIPLYTLYLCLGHVLKSGPIDMWKISPIFQGVGIAILIIQSVLGIYSIVGLSWIFVYFRDSFISTRDHYKWTLPIDFYGYAITEYTNRSTLFKIQETIPQYFHGEVLQRSRSGNNTNYGSIKFQVAFNLAVIWVIVFVVLSRGLRSYGKMVYLLMFLPICGIIILCTKILTLVPYNSVINLFSDTEWSEFFMNSHSWAAAAQETFLTWGLLGACVMQLASHRNIKNKTQTQLQRESAFVVCLTFIILLLAALFANTCMQVLYREYHYLPGSFESLKSSQFLWSRFEPLPGSAASTPIRYMGHYGSVVGVTIWRNGGLMHQFSGWQPLQLATQIVPATLGKFSTETLSPVWAVIFYFVLILFGIAQQLAIWHCVVCSIMAFRPKVLYVWSGYITFFSCVFGLLIGLLFTTEAGVRMVHYIDYVWAGSWWQCLIHVALICGVFVVRGRPYSGDVVVAALFSKGKVAATLGALLSFTWNVILPVVLCAVCVVDFRTGIQRQLYSWRRPTGYWPIINRQIAVALQQIPLLIVPVVAFIQTWRYMSKGPPDILDRVQNLYRPRMGSPSEVRPQSAQQPPVIVAAPDPPPKYTPPPSYSTATGARLLRSLRTSFRTLRRVTSRTESMGASLENQMPITLSESVDNEASISLQPPEYSGVFNTPTFTISDEVDGNMAQNRTQSSRTSLSLTRDILRRSFITKSDSAKSIRSSLRRSFRYGGNLTTSHEHLVGDVEPISNTVAMSAMLDTRDSPSHTRASVI